MQKRVTIQGIDLAITDWQKQIIRELESELPDKILKPALFTEDYLSDSPSIEEKGFILYEFENLENETARIFASFLLPPDSKIKLNQKQVNSLSKGIVRNALQNFVVSQEQE